MAYKIYPISVGEPRSTQYKVNINGENVPLHYSRVSAFPINWRWPGHQRPEDQTELCSFAMLETDEALSVSVTAAKPFTSVKVKPLSKNVTPEISNDGVVSFVLPGAGYYSVEFDDMHEALFIFADALSNYSEEDKTGDNVIYFGKGIHEAGKIELKSNQTLFIDEGAVVFGYVDALDADNIKILGRGILDGSRTHEKILYELGEKEIELLNKGFDVKNAVRHDAVNLEFCENVLIEGITLRDPLKYNISPHGCNNIEIANVKIIGSWRYNSDGIDLHNCCHAHIHDCFVRSYDDCFCIKGIKVTPHGSGIEHNGKSYDTFCDTLIERCVVWNDWGKALEFGAETCAKEIYGIVFKDIDIIRTTHGACTVTNVDYADIHDCVFEDIRVEYDDVSLQPRTQTSEDEAYFYDAHSRHMPLLFGVNIFYVEEYSVNKNVRGKIHDIVFKNINVFANKMPPSHFCGCDDSHVIENITVDGLYLNKEKIDNVENMEIQRLQFTENLILK